MNKKFFFVDMDGVIVQYGKGDKCDLSTSELNEEGYFISRTPSRIGLKAFENLLMEKRRLHHIFGPDVEGVCIITSAPSFKAREEKIHWLKRHTTLLDNKKEKDSTYLFSLSADDKVNVVDQFHGLYGKEKDIKKEDIIVVDDNLETLKAVQEFGYTPWHPTRFYNVFGV